MVAGRRVEGENPTMKPKIDIDAMTREEKLELIDELQRSLDPDDLVVSDEIAEELERRLLEYEENPGCTVTWEEVQDRLRRKFGW